MGCANANNVIVNQHDVTTQMSWEPDAASQTPENPESRENRGNQENRENKDGGNENMKQGFKSEAAQTAAPVPKAVEMSVEGN